MTGSGLLVRATSPATAMRFQPTASPRSYWAGVKLLTEEATARSTGRAGVGAPLARTATRTCDGRPWSAAGVNLKSAIAGARPAKMAASRGSAPDGVKVEILSKL